MNQHEEEEARVDADDELVDNVDPTSRLYHSVVEGTNDNGDKDSSSRKRNSKKTNAKLNMVEKTSNTADNSSHSKAIKNEQQQQQQQPPSKQDEKEKDEAKGKNNPTSTEKKNINTSKQNNVKNNNNKKEEEKEEEDETPIIYNKDDIVKQDDDDNPIEHDPTKQRLNIVLLYPDDWRHDTIGSEKPYIHTPFLDSLAKEGIRFTQNAVTTSVCWMSRATLWMGQYASRHKSYNLRCAWMAIPQNWKHSWVKILQKSGYYIGHIGKWQYWTSTTTKLFDWAYLFEGRHWELRFGGIKIHASDVAVEQAMKFFDERPVKDQPFVLSVAFYPPKAVGDSRLPGQQFQPTNETKKIYENFTVPLPESNTSHYKLPVFLQHERSAAKARFYERYRSMEHYQASMRNYYALVTGVDEACRKIIDRLKEEGLYNNTMIIFTTDNGLFHGSHGLAGKWYPFQESIRVPLIIYDPRMPKDKLGTLDDSLTLNIDLAETILGAAGVKPDSLMQGRDISDLYLPSNQKDEYHNTAYVDKEPWRDEFFYEFPLNDERRNRFIPPSTALVRKDWKYIHWPAHEREQFFNLIDDPLEINDLYNSTDEKIQEVLKVMRNRHDELRMDLHDPSYGGSGWNKCLLFEKLYPDL